MAHYLSYRDPGLFLQAHEFPAPRTVKISRFDRVKPPERDGEKAATCQAIYIFAKDGTEYPRPIKVPKSVQHGLALLFGADADDWKGKEVTVFATKCLAFGEVEACLRIEFPAEIESKIRKFMKKRKANPSAYMINGDA